MAISEAQLQSWTRPASDSEEEKCDRAARMIRGAIQASVALQRRDYRIIPQGSYENNTNARTNSDVDVCVVFGDVFFPSFTYTKEENRQSAGVIDSEYNYATDRETVGKALTVMFGKDQVTEGNKAFEIKSGTARVNADVVAAYEFRGYQDRQGGSTPRFTQGIAFNTKDGRRVINFPEQHAAKGRAKNIATTNYYKKATRIIKHARYAMLEAKIPEADGVSSFLLECALSNVPNEVFASYHTWAGTMQNILHHLHTELKTSRPFDNWTEVSGCKWLFQDSYDVPANWKPEQLQAFVLAAYKYIVR